MAPHRRWLRAASDGSPIPTVSTPTRCSRNRSRRCQRGKRRMICANGSAPLIRKFSSKLPASTGARGQPAIDHLKAALESGAHAVSANKGPIVHAYRELRELAKAKGRRFLFESTVMDGTPIFSMFPHSLPAAELRGFRGVLNATTNVVLTEMEKGPHARASREKSAGNRRRGNRSFRRSRRLGRRRKSCRTRDRADGRRY